MRYYRKQIVGADLPNGPKARDSASSIVGVPWFSVLATLRFLIGSFLFRILRNKEEVKRGIDNR